MPEWTLLSNHALVLVCLAQRPGVRLRDVASEIGITERATHRLLADLEEAGYVTRHRLGRRNFYEIHAEAPLTDPFTDGLLLGDFLRPLVRR